MFTIGKRDATSTITVRIKKEIKETLKKAGINISETVKNHLEELYWKIRVKEETEALRKILEKVKPSEKGFAEKSVREDRESHSQDDIANRTFPKSFRNSSQT